MADDFRALFTEIERVVEAAYDAVRAFARDHYIIGRNYFPAMHQRVNGWPFFRREMGIITKTPRSYEWALGETQFRTSDPAKRFLDFIATFKPLWPYLTIEGDASGEDEHSMKESDVARVTGTLIVSDIVDRYCSLHGIDESLDREKLAPIMIQWANAAFNDSVGFDIVVPIVGQTFTGNDPRQIDEGIRIELLDEQLQCARMGHLDEDVSDSDRVSENAEYALVLADWALPNSKTRWKRSAALNAEAFSKPLEIVDEFFAALRVEKNVEVGYGQVVLRHHGWAHTWLATLPPVSVFTVRAFPPRFESASYLEKPLPIDDATLAETVRVFKALRADKRAGVHLAARRLNTAYLRNTEEDSILDVTVGLETLLTHDTKNEITYHLAMRLGALNRIEPLDSYTSAQVFDATKRVYDFRSRIVHGGAKNLDKKRVIRIRPDQPIPAVDMGVRLLRHAIKVMVTHPDLTLGEIDKSLLGETSKPRGQKRASS